MVDNLTDPQPTAGLPKDPGSLAAAQDALLGLMDSEEKPEEENEASRSAPSSTNRVRTPLKPFIQLKSPHQAGRIES